VPKKEDRVNRDERTMERRNLAEGRVARGKAP
jgi:hypothetical protein